MKIHEYQAKDIFKKAGLPVSPGKVFNKKTLSKEAIAELGREGLVVKAQVHAGGRGKAGGIQLVNNADEAYQAALSLLGKRLSTYQASGSGFPIDSVLIEPKHLIRTELYLAFVIDREAALPCVVFSEVGGMEIEEVSRTRPDQIHKYHFDPLKGITDAAANQFLSKTSLSNSVRNEIAKIIVTLAKMMAEKDAALIEINPLGILENGAAAVVDAKIVFDDNALFRHADVVALRDTAQEDPREVEAKKFELSYVGLEGNIGCMVNGAGLAMATLDIIKLHGGEPANFLDVGGGASVEKVTAAFTIILSDSRVRAILVNIFGGIMKCDVIAEGILAAVRKMNLTVPLVVRLEGTNVDEGMRILKNSGLPIATADNLAEAAKQAVAAAKNPSMNEK